VKLHSQPQVLSPHPALLFFEVFEIVAAVIEVAQNLDAFNYLSEINFFKPFPPNRNRQGFRAALRLLLFLWRGLVKSVLHLIVDGFLNLLY
jgi:hypothetical protein